MTLRLLFPKKKSTVVERAIKKHLQNKNKQTKRELPEVLTVKELASYLRLNIKTVYEAINKGEIPGAKKIGGRIVIHRLTLEAWFRSCSGGHHGERNGGQV